MDSINVYNDCIDTDTLKKLKDFFNKCEYIYVPDNARIIIPTKNTELFRNVFSQLQKKSDHLDLVEIECFMIKKSSPDNFSYENNINNGQIFDLQIVRSAKKNNLIGNGANYKDAFVSVLLKQIIITTFTEKLLNINIFSTELNKIDNFTQYYNFEDTLYDPYYFCFSLLVHLKIDHIENEKLFFLLNQLKLLFSIFFEALKKHNSGILYYEKINDYLLEGYTLSSYEKKLQYSLNELTVEKINSSYGNSYFQYALPNEPILYNIPLKDNQCIVYPSNMIHKREPYETFTDDDIIHILFKCCNNLKK